MCSRAVRLVQKWELPANYLATSVKKTAGTDTEVAPTTGVANASTSPIDLVWNGASNATSTFAIDASQATTNLWAAASNAISTGSARLSYENQSKQAKAYRCPTANS